MVMNLYETWNFDVAPVILKQEARIERLRIELNTEKAKLVIMKQEVADLEKNRLEKLVDIEMEKQLTMEIRHLRRQCKVLELDGEAFYNNIYTGPQGPLTFGSPPLPPPRLRQHARSRVQYPGPQQIHSQPVDIEGPKWNCGICTFLNHPILDKCEQCEMPRIVHGTKPEAVNPNVIIDTLHFFNNSTERPGIFNNINNNSHLGDGRSARSMSMNNVPNCPLISRPIGFVLNDEEGAASLPGNISSSQSTPNMLRILSRRD